MISIVGHVSFLPHPKKKKKKPAGGTLPSCIPSTSQKRKKNTTWVTSTTWCCVAGGLEFGVVLILGSKSVRGHRLAPGVRLVRVPPVQTCYRTPGAKRVWNFASSGGRAPCQVEPSSLAPHDMTIATPQDRSAWTDLLHPAFHTRWA